MILDPERAVDLVIADQLSEFFTLVGSVQAGGHQDEDILFVDPLVQQRVEQGRQQQTVGNRSGNVTDQDAGRFFAFGQLGQGGAADRFEQGPPDRAVDVFQ